MDFIKMIMELPGEKRSQDVVEHTEWNSLWKLIVTQGNHSENYLEQLYDYFFNKEEGWVHKVQAELDGVQPYLEGVMTQPVGKAPDGSLWTYPSTESGTVPWGNVMGDITKQQDLIQKFNAKSDVGHGHSINTLTFNEGDIDSSWINYSPQSVPTSALEDLSVTTEKLNNGAVTSAKIASSAVINDSIANGSVSGAKIADGVITRVKLAQDALFSPNVYVAASRKLQASDLGKKLFASGKNNNCVLTLDDAASAEFAVGSEIFFGWINASSPLSIKFSGVNFVLKGSKEVNTSDKDVTVKLVEQGSAASIIKYNNVEGAVSSRWFVTGDVEVVT